MKLAILIGITLLTTTLAFAQDDNVIKVENGVTVSSGMPPSNSDVTKGGNVKNNFFDTRVQPSGDNGTGPNVDLPATNSAQTNTLTIPKKPAPAEIIKMKPIISPNSPGASGVPKAKKSDSPFRKSEDANVTETVKKPEAKPEIKSEILPDDAGRVKAGNDGDIMHEIEHIDKMGNEKPVATPNLPLNAIMGTDGKPDDEGGDAKQLSATGESGLPVPRFVTFKSGEVNARTGPGENYPIRWLYQRKNLPVEITAEFKLWRRIKDFDGEQSWVHHAMVSSRRYGIISRDITAKSEADGGDKVANFKTRRAGEN